MTAQASRASCKVYAQQALGYRRRQAIKAAAEHSWSGYVQHAWGMDELMPLSGRGKNSFGGLGATLVDTLDLLWCEA